MLEELLQGSTHSISQEGFVYICAKPINNLLRSYHKLELPNVTTNQRKKNKVPKINSEKIWDQLCLEWTRYAQAGLHRFESSSKKVPVVEELAGNLECPHGQLRPPPPRPLLVLQKDINRLLSLEGDRKRYWEEFGARCVPERISMGRLLPGVAPVCPTCEAEKADAAQQKKFRIALARELKAKFPSLSSGKLSLVKDGTSKQLREGEYVLIPSDWRQKWCDSVDKGDDSMRLPLQFSTLRCEHDLLRYNPAAFFELGVHNPAVVKDPHPHMDAYLLVPKEEAKLIHAEYGGVAKQQPADAERCDWCSMSCRVVVGDNGFPASRIYTCSPRPCDRCTGADACYTLDTTVVTDMNLTTASSVGFAGERQLRVKGGASGLDVKALVLAEYGFQSVDPAQLILNVNDRSFGDMDLLRQILGQGAFILRATLKVEIYEFMMSEPAPKRQRCSLLDSNLAGGRLV
jgi:hypothetical protein